MFTNSEISLCPTEIVQSMAAVFSRKLFIKLICRLSHTFSFDVRCPAQQSGIFIEIPLRDSFNLLDSI